MGSQYAAIHSHMDIMTQNDRIVMEFDTEHFGTVVQVGSENSAHSPSLMYCVE